MNVRTSITHPLSIEFNPPTQLLICCTMQLELEIIGTFTTRIGKEVLHILPEEATLTYLWQLQVAW